MQFSAQLVNYLCTWNDTPATISVLQKGRWHSLWWSDHFLVPAVGSGLENRESLQGRSLFSAVATELFRTHRRRCAVGI